MDIKLCVVVQLVYYHPAAGKLNNCHNCVLERCPTTTTPAPTIGPGLIPEPDPAVLENTCAPVSNWNGGTEIPAPNTIIDMCTAGFSNGVSKYKDGMPLYSSSSQTGDVNIANAPCFIRPADCMNSDGFTISFYFRNNLGYYSTNVLETTDSNTRDGIQLYNKDSNFMVQVLWEGYKYYLYLYKQRDMTQWTLITVTAQDPGGVSLYIDDVLQKTEETRQSTFNANIRNTDDVMTVSKEERSSFYWYYSSYRKKIPPVEIQIGHIYYWETKLTDEQVKLLSPGFRT